MQYISTIIQPLYYVICHIWQFKAQDSTALVNTYQPWSYLTSYWLMANEPSWFQLSTDLELKLEVRLALKYLLSKKQALISFSSQGQTFCLLQISSFSSQSSWETEPVWVSSFSSEVWLIQLACLVQKWWDPMEGKKVFNEVNAIFLRLPKYYHINLSGFVREFTHFSWNWKGKICS